MLERSSIVARRIINPASRRRNSSSSRQSSAIEAIARQRSPALLALLVASLSSGSNLAKNAPHFWPWSRRRAWPSGENRSARSLPLGSRRCSPTQWVIAQTSGDSRRLLSGNPRIPRIGDREEQAGFVSRSRREQVSKRNRRGGSSEFPRRRVFLFFRWQFVGASFERGAEIAARMVTSRRSDFPSGNIYEIVIQGEVNIIVSLWKKYFLPNMNSVDNWWEYIFQESFFSGVSKVISRSQNCFIYVASCSV